jgi:transcriptional regulator
MANRSPDLLPGTLDMLVLKTLTHAPNHGYGIARRIRQVSGEALTVGEGSLYPALQRLLVNGWVRAEWTASDSGRKVRQYSITAAGRKQLARETSDFGFLMAAISRVMESA